jgi:hypothetical protein
MRVFAIFIVCSAVAAPTLAGQSGEKEKSKPPTFELTPEAYIQLDWRGYPDSSVVPGTGRLDFDTFEVRRLRAGFDGRWRGIRFELKADPADVDGTPIKDAYAEIRPGGYEIRFGQLKLPGSREYGKPAQSLDFLERAGFGRVLAAQRDLGVAVHGDLGKRFDYEVGVFAGDDNGSARRAGVTGAGRLEWEPSKSWVLAISGSEGRLNAVDSDPENGLEGRLSSGYRFFENVYVDGRRTRVGGDVEWSPAAWQFTVEGLRVREERRGQGVDLEDLPSVVDIGASVTARWRFAPRRDVAVRYEYLGFDDVGPETTMASVRPRAADVRARSGHGVTFGGSWGVKRWLRVMGNAGVEWFSDPRSAPDPDDSPFWTLGTRLQFSLPNTLRWRVP